MSEKELFLVLLFILCSRMRFEFFLCGLWLSAGGTSNVAEAPIGFTTALEHELSPDEIEIVCPAVQDRTTIEAGATVASLWLSPSERITIDEIRLLGKETRMKCIRATCTEALESLASGIRVHDLGGTWKGMKRAIGSLSPEAAQELLSYTELVDESEMADVMVDLYRRAEKIAHVDRAALELTSEQMETIGKYSLIVIWRAA